MRDAAWLTAERARAWCRVLAIVSALAALGWVGLSHGGVDATGKPLGTDFVSFWTASRLARDGHPEAAYVPALHAAAERALFPTASDSGYAAFFYPPTFLLLCLPMASVPYPLALAMWLAASFGALFVALRIMLPQRWAILPMLAFPAMMLNATHGQNGFLSAACLAWGCLLLERRPLMAGACLGLLAFKPHLLVATPVTLLAGCRWRVLTGAALAAAGLAALSWLVLGTAAWRGFLAATPLARATLEDGLVGPEKMASVFAAVRLLHGGVTFAYAAQAMVAAVALAAAAWAAARRPGARPEGALLACVTLLATPFLLDYDLVWLALPIAWVAAEAQRESWHPWEKLVLLAAYLLPLVARPVATLTGIPLAPLAIAALLAVVVRRAAGQRGIPAMR